MIKHLCIFGVGTNIGVEDPDAYCTTLAPELLLHHLSPKLSELDVVVEGPVRIKGSIADKIAAKSGDNVEKLKPIADYCNQIASESSAFLNQQHPEQNGSYLPLFLGGDHSVSMGTYAGVANHFHEKLGILWIDAHGDFNTWASSKTKNVHGMALAAILGRTFDGEIHEKELFSCCPTDFRPDPDNIIVLGARDLDFPEEVTRFRKLGVKVYTTTDIDKYGLGFVLSEIREKFDRRGIRKLHVSLDLDSIDPIFAPGVFTPVEAGLTQRELFLIADYLSDAGLIASLDIVEYYTDFDIQSKTLRLATNLIIHLLGRPFYPYFPR